MGFGRKISYFFKNIRKKFRLSLRDQHTESEVWYMHISPLELIGGSLALLLVLFILILTIVAYTPVLNLIPGYSGNKQREAMIQNIMRVDSIERQLNELIAYTDDMTLIMSGKTPVVRNVTQVGDSLAAVQPEAVERNAADSALRVQMEGDGVYGLSQTHVPRVNREEEYMPPVSGVVATHFNPADGRFGIGIATASDQQVMAVAEGTVIFSTWSPGDGHTVQIQHTGNLISIYRHCTQTVKPTGSRVRMGEVIGYTGEGLSGEGGKGLFEFELWRNGVPLDPENYIVF